MHFNQPPALEQPASVGTTPASVPMAITSEERAQLIRICLRTTRDSDTAEDLVQETLLEAWRNWHKLRDVHDPQSRMRWFATIASHICHRWARSYGRDLRHTIPLDTAATSGSLDDHSGWLADRLISKYTVDADLEHAERMDLLERALHLLPRETRDALVARYLAELPLREIALRYGLSEGALSVRLHRGRQALHQVLATTLREDATAYGLIEHAAESWQETRIWCPMCGQTRLQGQLGGTPVCLRLRCTRCRGANASFIDHVSFQHILDGLKTFKSALNRVMVWADPYYHHGTATGAVICVRCNHPAPLLVNQRYDAHSSLTHQGLGVRMACSCNAINNSDLAGMALFTPKGRAFWRTHPRIHLTPERHVETQGRDVIVISYRSVSGTATFDTLYSRDTFELLATSETPGT